MRRPDRGHLAALLILGLAAFIYLHHIATWLIDGDEEGYLYAAWRVSLGELPYRDFLTPQLPAFLFPGGLLVRLFGRDPAVLRAGSAGLMLLAGWLTYLTGRRLFGPVAGLIAMALLLLWNDVFLVARVFRPEATLLACGALALYLFVRADETGARRGYAAASLFFGLALLSKLFGLLPWAATAAYVGADGLWGRRGRRRAAGDLAAVLLPGGLLVGLVGGAFIWLTPETMTAVLVHHLRQGAQLSRWQVVQKTLAYYGSVLSWHGAVISLVPAGILAARKLAPGRGMVLVWQLPTVLAFVFLSRQLWARHLLYLLPAITLLFGAAMAWLVSWRQGSDRLLATVFSLGVVSAIILPHLLDDLDDFARIEIGTRRLGTLVAALAPEDTRILADSAGAGFYGGRATTKTAAGLSEGAAESGQIRGRDLLQEMAAGNVSVVILDLATQGGQLADLVDYPAFEAAVRRDFLPLGRYWRFEQPLDIFVRPDVPRPGLDFGWGKLVGLRLDRPRLAAGEALGVDLAWQVVAAPEGTFTAFLHLVGPDGQTWAVGDSLLDNALLRSTEEWQPGEVVATPLRITTDPGMPPGRYRLLLGVYERETGRRLGWRAPEGSSGDAFDAGEIEIERPDRPPDGRRLGFGPAGSIATAGPYRLLAADLPETVRAGWAVPVALTWQAAEAPGADHRLELTATDAHGAKLAEATVDPGGPDWPTGRWRRGEVATVRVPIRVDPSASGGPASLTARWLDATGRPIADPLALGSLVVQPLGAAMTAAPEIPRPVTATLGGELALLGSNLPATAPPGASLGLTLYWQAHATPPTSYSTLVHLLDGAGNVVAQADGPPAGGSRPTTSWRPGEVIPDTRRLDLPADLPPGDYTVLAGLYDAGDSAYPRLPATVDGARREDGRVPLGTLAVGP